MLNKNKMKQLKLPNIFRNREANPPEELAEDAEEVMHLEEKLKELHNKWFNLQRKNSKRKFRTTISEKENAILPKEAFIRNSLNKTKQDMHVLRTLTGTEVKSFVQGKHCCVVYHLHSVGPKDVTHGLMIEINNGVKTIPKSSMPLGFNLKGVIDEYEDNLMSQTCLNHIRTALVAYYSRLQQYEALKNMLHSEADLFKSLDASYIQIAFVVQNIADEDGEPFKVTLKLQYSLYEDQPEMLTFDTDMPKDVKEVLLQQCVIFKKEYLRRAFKDTFIEGAPFRFVEQVGVRPSSPPRRRPRKRNTDYRNDDTFHPEDCSDDGEDADVTHG